MGKLSVVRKLELLEASRKPIRLQLFSMNKDPNSSFRPCIQYIILAETPDRKSSLTFLL